MITYIDEHRSSFGIEPHDLSRLDDPRTPPAAERLGGAGFAV